MEDLSRQRFADVRTLFHALLDMPPEARRDRLAATAAGDPELAGLVQRLLDEADTQAEADKLRAPGIAAQRLAPGSIVAGRYRILRLLGEGGMGDVYLAERVDDIAQKVALKLMRGGGESMLTRFLRERQILARLNHPHIAHLTDGGLSEAGVPWFALEYVDGTYITAACDQRRLDLRARARLFVQICRAVQFAHRNLVLHRDLKPSNILVDAEGAPKLLDFGIAKLLDDTAPDKTHTVTMTPAYAAPEQLRGEPVTTAADIYQLGLVLYELFAGISAHELRRRRVLARGDAFARLDQAFAQSAPDEAERIARARGVGAARLRRALHGDLERIVSKAVADDPRERYDTAQALGEDLDRWASGLPVQAQRGSFGYRARKWLRRHAAAAALVALFALGLLVSSVVAVNRAYHERQQRQRAETVLAFMRDVFRQGDPQNSDGRSAGPADLLERAAAKLDARRDVDDVTRAMLLNEIAGVFDALGRGDKALPHAERAVRMLEPVREAHPAEYLAGVGTYIGVLREQGNSAQEVELIEHALPLARRTAQGDRLWPALFLSYRGYAQLQREDVDGAEASFDEAIAEFERDGPRSLEDLGGTLYQRALLAVDRGDVRSGMALYHRAMEAHERAPDGSKFSRLATEDVIARGHCLLGETDAGVADSTSVVERLGALLGPNHNRVLMARINLVQCQLNRGAYAEAARELDAVQASRGDAALTPIQDAFVDQVATRLDLYRLRDATALNRAEAGARALRALQPPRKYLLRADWLLGESLLQANRCAAATPALEEALAIARTLAGATASSLVGEIEDSLGRCALLAGHHEEAQTWFGQAVEQFGAAQVAGAPSIVRSEIHLLWSQVLAGHQAAKIDEMEARRSALVGALGTEERAQVWQLDLLIDDLDRQFGRPGIDAGRRARAQAGLLGLSGAPQVPRFVGLNSFL
jgi:serine/threonine-protein kinase